MKKVLITEDELLVAKTYSFHLKKQGFEILAIVNNADLAVEKCRELQPDVIIMDVHLRDNTNGFVAARKIREFNKVPIIFTTGSSVSEAERETAGMENVSILIKPVEPSEIERVINKIFF